MVALLRELEPRKAVQITVKSIDFTVTRLWRNSLS